MKKVNTFILFSLLASIFCVGAFFLTLHFVQTDLIISTKKNLLEKEILKEQEEKKTLLSKKEIETRLLEKSSLVRPSEYLVLEAQKSNPFSNPDYIIYYYIENTSSGEKTGSVRITLYATPFVDIRKKAEEDFLNFLNITKEEACQLDATISIPFSIDTYNAGKNFHLSFCE